MKNKKLIIIISSIVLAICLFLVIFFIVKSNKNDSKKDNGNYTLKFVYMVDDTEVQKLNIKFVDNKLNKMVLIYTFDNDNDLNAIYNIYKNDSATNSSYKSVKKNKKTLELEYTDSEKSKYSGYTKNNLIKTLEESGYTYIK